MSELSKIVKEVESLNSLIESSAIEWTAVVKREDFECEGDIQQYLRQLNHYHEISLNIIERSLKSKATIEEKYISKLEFRDPITGDARYGEATKAKIIHAKATAETAHKDSLILRDDINRRISEISIMIATQAEQLELTSIQQSDSSEQVDAPMSIDSIESADAENLRIIADQVRVRKRRRRLLKTEV